MGKIKLGDKLIEDRRTNGARIKLDTGDWIKVLTIFITIIGSIVFIQIRVKDHSIAIASQEVRLSDTEKMARSSVKDIEYMKETLARIDKNMERLLLKK